MDALSVDSATNKGLPHASLCNAGEIADQRLVLGKSLRQTNRSNFCRSHSPPLGRLSNLRQQEAECIDLDQCCTGASAGVDNLQVDRPVWPRIGENGFWRMAKRNDLEVRMRSLEWFYCERVLPGLWLIVRLERTCLRPLHSHSLREAVRSARARPDVRGSTSSTHRFQRALCLYDE